MRSRFYSWCGSLIKNSIQNAYIEIDACLGAEQITHQKILSNKEATTPRVKQIKYVYGKELLGLYQEFKTSLDFLFFRCIKCVCICMDVHFFSAFQPLLYPLNPQKTFFPMLSRMMLMITVEEHCSKIRGSCLIKCSNEEGLQNLPHFFEYENP